MKLRISLEISHVLRVRSYHLVLRQAPRTFHPCVRGARDGISEREESCLIPVITVVDMQ